MKGQGARGKGKPDAEAAYFKGMANLARKQGKPDLARSYEMGSVDVFQQVPPKGNHEQ